MEQGLFSHLGVGVGWTGFHATLSQRLLEDALQQFWTFAQDSTCRLSHLPPHTLCTRICAMRPGTFAIISSLWTSCAMCGIPVVLEQARVLSKLPGEAMIPIESAGLLSLFPNIGGNRTALRANLAPLNAHVFQRALVG